jgi:hypothetical protein
LDKELAKVVLPEPAGPSMHINFVSPHFVDDDWISSTNSLIGLNFINMNLP